MHYGYRIVEDMIQGLSNYLDEKGMKSVNELRGKAIPAYQEWGDLDLGYKLVAKIDAKKCIGCQLCVTACHDGAHQCIFTGNEEKARPPHAHAEGMAKPPTPFPIGAIAKDRVPWVDEPECVGCNLCQLVCPVPDCIQMVEVPGGKSETWNDRIREGRHHVPGGIHEKP
jgi:dihydropyrimidine dehydrogenase (NAD+) subunit PreA